MKRRLAVLGTCLLVLSGCKLGQGLYGVDLPGGADLGDHPYTVTAQFKDALDLVPQAGVKVNDVPVGRVESITLDKHTGLIANVTVELNGDVRLPANATAAIRQTSLLGEKYVDLAAPLSTPAQGTLRNGATIDVNHTSDGVEVEQVFGALSLLLNGGGLGKLQDIYRELNAFAGGHEQAIRQFFESVSSTVTTLNQRKQSILDAIQALADLSASLQKNNTQIATLLKAFAPGIAVLADQRTQLITLLNSLNRLSTVTVSTLDASKQNIIDDFRALAPVVQNLAAAGQALPESLQILATYPFPDAATTGIKGDYLNSWVQEVLRTPGGQFVQSSWPSSGSGTSVRTGTAATPTLIAPPPSLLPPTSSAAPGLPSTITLSPSGSATPSGTSTSSASPSSGSSSGSSSSGSSSSGTAWGTPSGSSSGSPSGSSSGSSAAASSSATKGGR